MYVFSKYICILTDLVYLSLLTKPTFLVLYRFPLHDDIHHLRVTAEFLSEYTLLLELHTIGSGRRKLPKKPHKNTANLSSELY